MNNKATDTAVANDRRVVRCFKTREPRRRTTTDVPDYVLARDIDAGSRFFWERRPWLHRDFFQHEFGALEHGRRASA